LLASAAGELPTAAGAPGDGEPAAIVSEIHGVLAANDAMAMGAIEALEGANRTAKVIGFNGTKEAVDAIKAGKLLASGDYNGFLQGCISKIIAARTLRKRRSYRKSCSSRSWQARTTISLTKHRLNPVHARLGNRHPPNPLNWGLFGAAVSSIGPALTI
jgi:hypothetical protein